ncbi:uncharacterized protein B0I36DRAFT_349447 [Microdochium trichocladiopsis]|uniref:Haloacid dehalogenase-like hydrolase n=1 Tax=Microdochium trichocladiopsis TaxID=1682393 RepID=A0A9P8Y7H5_9PEZI|nr:uncharacterized protein B0I36DRAFT_349447 [Microdochium trichocladiopsis]KAH7031362.1 hypothetical protein B0I36DRAFT_349447 [Microdochium trichocladiopsis]
MARKPNLLLCFDAFGTLFRPKYSVAHQYGDVARQCGLTGFRDEDLQASLKAAMKAESKQNPNFGRATGLGATKWWTNVIHNTFKPLLSGTSETIPADLAPRLLHRFATVEAYTLESPDLVSQLRSLKTSESSSSAVCGKGPVFDRIIIGVVTNSDDRVPGILSSAGFSVSPLRFGTELSDPAALAAVGDAGHDIDFHCMSYDVGVEKPDRAIFAAAESMLKRVLAAREAMGGDGAPQLHEGPWEKIYVGDEYAKDVEGSLNAGWRPVLLDHEGPSSTPDGRRILMLEEAGHDTFSIASLFEKAPVIGVRSIQELVKWLRNDV